MWKFLDTGKRSAIENMQIDADLLERLKPSDSPILHFYDWERKSATYGYFLPIDQFLDLEQAKKWNLDLAKRPTGGGTIFHISDFAFSVLIPAAHEGYSSNTLNNYDFINKQVLRGVKNFFEKPTSPILLPNEPIALDSSSARFCMAKPTKYDVMLGGKKIAGSAQRRRKWGYLHQGSIAIALPQEKLLQDVLLKDTKVLEAMKENSYTILGSDWKEQDLLEVRNLLKNSMKEVFLN
ncbi:MAG: lipoate--protein ligase family protein, partial [Simkaniaceae bacterium]|nr:lipoate--protein ligase family protein [Simkaniaceae bacterium]